MAGKKVDHVITELNLCDQVKFIYSINDFVAEFELVNSFQV